MRGPPPASCACKSTPSTRVRMRATLSCDESEYYTQPKGNVRRSVAGPKCRCAYCCVACCREHKSSCAGPLAPTPTSTVPKRSHRARAIASYTQIWRRRDRIEERERSKKIGGHLRGSARRSWSRMRTRRTYCAPSTARASTRAAGSNPRSTATPRCASCSPRSTAQPRRVRFWGV